MRHPDLYVIPVIERRLDSIKYQEMKFTNNGYNTKAGPWREKEANKSKLMFLITMKKKKNLKLKMIYRVKNWKSMQLVNRTKKSKNFKLNQRAMIFTK